MAGMLRLDEGTWTASYGLFDWVVDAIADRVSDPDVVAILREITDKGLGYLDPAELGPTGAAAVLETIPGLPEIADRELPPSFARPEVLEHLRELVALVELPDGPMADTTGRADAAGRRC